MIKLLVIWLAALTLIGSASALMMPMPISLSVQNEGELAGYEIEMTNMRTGVTQFLTTNDDGFVLYDWSNEDTGYFPGDVIRTIVVGCDEPECTVFKTIDNKLNPIYFTIDLTNAVCPQPTVCPDKKCTRTVCAETFPCPDCICPDVIDCPDLTCPDCPDLTCPDPVPCDTECDPPQDWLYWVVGLVCLATGVGTKKLHEVWVK